MDDKDEKNKTYSKGIFWFIDERLVCFQISCDENGNPLEPLNEDAVSKSGVTYNHEKYWATLPKLVTSGKDYRYYPRGRVEIVNGQGKIFLNPHICTNEIKKLIVEAFGLSKIEIRMFADGSGHYWSYLDGKYDFLNDFDFDD